MTATNDYFSLEALDAQCGDCLLLHHGTKAEPRLLLIDGGPPGVYRKTLGPRLQAIAEKRRQRPLRIDHVVVTHLDSDHVAGIVAFADTLAADPVATSRSFWVNAFQDPMSELPAEVRAAKAALPQAAQASVDAELASIAEGQKLLDALAARHVKVNGRPFRPGAGLPLLVAEDAGVALPLGDALTATLVCPSRKHLRALAEEWKKKAAATAGRAPAEAADYVDRSVYNLSSLVIVVEAQGAGGETRRMLLTGDARGDHVLAGLGAAGFLDAEGRAHFDLQKVAHHGSDRDFEPAFFDSITADHYVISANGRDDNPSTDVLCWIAASRRRPNATASASDYKVWLTNARSDLFPALQRNIDAATEAEPALKPHLRFRDPSRPGLRVDLLEPLDV